MNRYIVKITDNGGNYSFIDRENGLAVVETEEKLSGGNVIADVTGNTFYSAEAIEKRHGKIITLEIERKWLVRIPDNLEEFQYENIEQAYLAPGSGFRGRVRCLDDKFIYTEKAPTSDPEVRIENEKEITAEEYRSLLKNKVGNIIKKRRYIIPYGGHTFEFDVFENTAEAGYALMEAELAHKDETVELPPFVDVISEVTDDVYYTNRNLSAMDTIRLLKD